MRHFEAPNERARRSIACSGRHQTYRRAADEAGPDEHGHWIESRVPFLDHKLVEFAGSLPDSGSSGWTTKRVLRESMKGLLPRSILNRPKMGFPVLFGRWMRSGWNTVAREVLFDRRPRERGLIDRGGRSAAARSR